MVVVIVVVVLVIVALFVASTGRSASSPRRGPACSSARPLQPNARARAEYRRALRRARAPADRPARAGGELQATARDHEGQRRRGDRDVLYFTINDPRACDLRDRQSAPGDRAVDGHYVAQRDRRHHTRGVAHESRETSTRSCAEYWTRRPENGASASTASRSSPSTRHLTSRRRWRSRCARARPPRRDSDGRGHQAGGDPHRRGREAVCGAEGRGGALRGDPSGRRVRRRRSRTVFAAIHAGDVDQKAAQLPYLQMLPQLAQGEANKCSSSRPSSRRLSPASATPSPRAGRRRSRSTSDPAREPCGRGLRRGAHNSTAA